jgi:hypothetical protein
LSVKDARYEIHAIVEGEQKVYFADEVAFELEGWLSITPKRIVSSSEDWEPKNIGVILPAHAVESIKEYKPVKP